MIERGADCEGCRISIYSLGGVTEPGPVLGNISGGEREKRERDHRKCQNQESRSGRLRV